MTGTVGTMMMMGVISIVRRETRVGSSAFLFSVGAAGECRRTPDGVSVSRTG